MPPRGWDGVTVWYFLPWKQQSTFKTSFQISVKTEHLRRMFSKSTDCLYSTLTLFNCCGFRCRFYHVYSIEHEEDETFWALQSLSTCIVLNKTRHSRRNSMFYLSSNLFLLFWGNILCWNDSSSPAGFMSLSPFCHILCEGEGEGGLLSSSKHILKYSFSVQFFRLPLLRWSEVLYYPFLFPSVKLPNVDARRNESLLFITIFEVLNGNNYKTTKYCPSEMMRCRCRKKSFEWISSNSVSK